MLAGRRTGNAIDETPFKVTRCVLARTEYLRRTVASCTASGARSVKRIGLFPAFIAAALIGAYCGLFALKAQIDALNTPRKLRGEVQHSVVRVAERYPGIQFTALSELGSEPVHFVLEIASALKAGGWSWQPYNGPSLKTTPLDGRPAVGHTTADHIEVQAGPGADAASEALAKVLRKFGRVVVVPIDADNAVNVIVGSKP